MLRDPGAATWRFLDHADIGAGHSISGAAGCLKVLDISYGQTPIQEVRDYLAGKYDERFGVHPRVFEEVVASVFRDLGYQATVTNYSGDNGVDVFLTKAMRGWPIELMDADRFFAMLELAQFQHYEQDTTDIVALSRSRSVALRHEYRRV